MMPNPFVNHIDADGHPINNSLRVWTNDPASIL
jgi:hypothetical protein